MCQGYELDKIHQVMYLHYITCGRALYRQMADSSRMMKFIEKILQSCEIKVDFSYLCKMNKIGFLLFALPLIRNELEKPQNYYVTSDNFYPFEILEFTHLFIW